MTFQNDYRPYQIEKREFEISQEEMESNINHSKKRIKIEHAICRLKSKEYLPIYLETN